MVEPPQGAFLLDLNFQARRSSAWPTIIQRNQWFGEWAAAALAKVASGLVFSYSYPKFRSLAGGQIFFFG